MLSNYFTSLITRVAALEAKFIGQLLNDEQTNPLTFTTDSELSAAYLLLVHAEIEDYLEKKARNVCNQYRFELKSGKLPPIIWTYSLGNYFQINIPQEIPYDHDAMIKVNERILRCCDDFLSDNNGIKSKTLLTVSLILGLDLDKIDVTLCARLNAIGEARGDVAHKSISKVTTIRNPSSEKLDVDNTISLLKSFFYPACP